MVASLLACQSSDDSFRKAKDFYDALDLTDWKNTSIYLRSLDDEGLRLFFLNQGDTCKSPLIVSVDDFGMVKKVDPKLQLLHCEEVDGFDKSLIKGKIDIILNHQVTYLKVSEESVVSIDFNNSEKPKWIFVPENSSYLPGVLYEQKEKGWYKLK